MTLTRAEARARARKAHKTGLNYTQKYPKLTREAARERARQAHKRAFEPIPDASGEPAACKRTTIIRQGMRADSEIVTAAFREACDGGLTAAKVLAGPTAPDALRAARDGHCRACKSATLLSTGAILCEAVECPRWRWLDRRAVNVHEDALCPIGTW